MNEARMRSALSSLAAAAHELGAACDREAAEYGPVWHGIGRNADALRDSFSRADLDDLLRSVASLFGYHPGAFTEVYVQRSDFDEQMAENAKFDALKERVAGAVAEVRAALGYNS